MVVNLKKPNDELDKFLLRMPDGLRERIKRAAEGNNRSMNAEIVATLEEHYPAIEFDFGTFMQEWMVPIVRAPSTVERRILIDGANEFLRAASPDMRLATEETPDGKIEVVLHMGEVRLRVGDGEPLTLSD